jgi:2-isopropylmalate synthase
MTLDDKVRIATQLERMKVDVIEAGFTASSNGDYAAISRKQLLEHARLAVLQRCLERRDRSSLP